MMKPPRRRRASLRPAAFISTHSQSDAMKILAPHRRPGRRACPLSRGARYRAPESCCLSA